MLSGIQGRICRSQWFGELRLTEAVYLPNSYLSEHEHEFGCFGFMVDGELFEQFGIQKFAYRHSTVFFRPPQIVHRDTVTSCGARCMHIELSSRWLERLVQLSPIFKDPSVFEDGQIRRVAKCIYFEWLQQDNVSSLAIEGLTCEMATYLCRSRPDRTDATPLWLKNVREMIQANYRQRVSLCDLARAVSVHPVHVARQFRRHFRTSVGDFIRLCRIEFAKQELIAGDKPLIEIAYESGFSQQAHFTMMFKRYTGTTPLEYRKRCKSGRLPLSRTSKGQT